MRKSELKEMIKSAMLAEADDSKKGNSKEQKRMEGAIKDDRDHIKNLKKDIEDNERKLARLKKDYKKDVIKEGELTEDLTQFEDYVVGMFNSGVEEEEGPQSDVWEKSEYANSDLYEDAQEFLDLSDYLKSVGGKATLEGNPDINLELLRNGDIRWSADVTLAEAKDVNVDVEEDEDIDVDIEKDVVIDDEEVESDIEVKTSVPGESADEEAVQGLLIKAQEEAAKLGDEKLTDQIGNTITYFTRAHISQVDEAEDFNSDVDDINVSDDEAAADEGFGLEENKKSKHKNKLTESKLRSRKLKRKNKSQLTEEVKRFKKLAGIVSENEGEDIVSFLNSNKPELLDQLSQNLQGMDVELLKHGAIEIGGDSEGELDNAVAGFGEAGLDFSFDEDKVRDVHGDADTFTLRVGGKTIHGISYNV
jgi:hypothetical protein